MLKQVSGSPRTWAAACAVLVAAFSACGDGSPTESPPRRPPGVAVVSGASVSDTAAAVLTQPLIVEVTDAAGKPLSGVEVVFRGASVSRPGGPAPVIRVIGVGDPDPLNFREQASAVTDATGRAAIRVGLGIVAGPAQVAITVPTQGFTATASYTVAPGAGVQLTLAPRDTAVYVGASYTLRAAVADRWGNAVTAAPALTVAGSAATLSGTTVRGESVGRAGITAQGIGQSLAAFVTVVPNATLMAMRTDGVYQFGADGSGMRRVSATTGGRFPRWLPDGQRFVFTDGPTRKLQIAQADGSFRPLVTGGTLDMELGAHPSRDGQWVYFGGYTPFSSRPYRVRTDGSGLEVIPGYTEAAFASAYPSPSPDGTHVAYFTEEGDSRSVKLRVQNLATGALVASVSGHAPEWSHGALVGFTRPNGDVYGPIVVMNGDGSGTRVVAPGAVYQFGLDWSPDDKWIVARNAFANQLELVEVATGRILPLPYSTGMYEPAWKP